MRFNGGMAFFPVADWRIYRAVRRFERVSSDPSADIRDVYLAARMVKYTAMNNGYPRRWHRHCDRAARVSSRIKRETGNRILLWILYPGLDGKSSFPRPESSSGGIK